MPPAENRWLASPLPGARYKEIAGLQHFANIEAPDASTASCSAGSNSTNARADPGRPNRDRSGSKKSGGSRLGDPYSCSMGDAAARWRIGSPLRVAPAVALPRSELTRIVVLANLP